MAYINFTPFCTNCGKQFDIPVKISVNRIEEASMVEVTPSKCPHCGEHFEAIISPITQEE